MKYAYGVSFNCEVGDDAVGGGSEGYTTLDYLSNDLNKLNARLLDDNNGVLAHSHDVQKYKIVRHNHEMIGKSANIGGSVIGVMVTDDDDEFITAVIFREPDGTPTIVE